MNEEQLYDAAEREMDVYRAEITRITAQRDEARAELATLRELRAIVAHFTDIWSELLPDLPDSYGCQMNCAEANAAAGLYRALDRAGTAKAIIAAHAATDDEEERASHREDGYPHGRTDEQSGAGLPS